MPILKHHITEQPFIADYLAPYGITLKPALPTEWECDGIVWTCDARITLSDNKPLSCFLGRPSVPRGYHLIHNTPTMHCAITTVYNLKRLKFTGWLTQFVWGFDQDLTVPLPMNRRFLNFGRAMKWASFIIASMNPRQ